MKEKEKGSHSQYLLVFHSSNKSLSMFTLITRKCSLCPFVPKNHCPHLSGSKLRCNSGAQSHVD